MNNSTARSNYRGDVADQYDNKRSYSQKWFRENQIISSIIKEFNSGSSILDTPIGTGRFLEYYEKGNHFVFGLDISMDMINQAKMKMVSTNNLLQMIVGDAERIPMSDKSVDYVICMRLLNLIPIDVVRNILIEFNRIARCGVVVGIRTRRILTSGDLLKYYALDFISLLRNNIQSWDSLKDKFFRKLTVFSKRNYDQDNSKKNEDKPPEWFRLHDEKDLQTIFPKGMIINQISCVDVIRAYSQKEVRPYSIYSLHPIGL